MVGCHDFRGTIIMRRRLEVLRGLALAALIQSALSAQAPVGSIDQVAERVGGGQPRKISNASESVQIRRGGTETWILAGPKMGLVETDRLRVRRYVNALVKVERPTQRGTLTFLSEVLTSGGGRVFHVPGIPVEQSEYLIGEIAGPQELAVRIERGALIVHWSTGLLTVYAAGIPAAITGTRVGFAMDSTGDEGLMFLEEGIVTFPSSPGVRVSQGEVVRLRRGFPPEVFRPSPTEANEYRQGMRYNEKLWSRFKPFWQKPAFLLPAAAVVGAVTVVGATSGGGTNQGTVVGTIPF